MVRPISPLEGEMSRRDRGGVSRRSSCWRFPMLTVDNIYLHYGAAQALRGVSLAATGG